MSVRVRLEPRGLTLHADLGTPLRDLLFEHGIEFPCGGRGTCRGCRVRIPHGAAPPSADDRRVLRADEIDAGWRLACRAVVTGDTIIAIEQWDTVVLGDERRLEVTPGEGIGLAVDVGTTTLVVQLVDLATARLLGVRTALNPQAALGGDVMSRIEAALTMNAAATLRDGVRMEVARMVRELCAGHPPPDRAVLVGNTTMHHLFCGLDVASLAEAPYETEHGGMVTLDAADLGWPMSATSSIRFLPCIGGFVGSDVLAGIRAVGLDEARELSVLIDLGTNAEIVVGSRAGLLCASTAAGPAFEGGRISSGMRAATGAISEVAIVDGRLVGRVLGGGPARGLCGSGLIDAIRCGLELGHIAPSGRIGLPDRRMAVVEGVALAQADIREVQLAKAAIAAGLRTLLARLGAGPGDVARVHLAGAFGNYVSAESAGRIGLLPVPAASVRAGGNTALLGAKLALFDRDEHGWTDLLARITHVSLGNDEPFQQAYVEAIAFPA